MSNANDNIPTPFFAPAPSVMLVEVDEPARAWCRDALPGVAQLWVAHSLAARERIPVTRPLVIVMPDRDRDVADVSDVASSTGAEVLRFSDAAGRDYFVAALKDAVHRAETRRLLRP